MILLRIAWSVLKGVLFVTEAVLDGLSNSGRAAGRSDGLKGDDEPPTRQRTSHFYSGPGSRPHE
ncbi:hypothetical protein CVO96_20140 [Deinococcus koreensis]|uniref:Uncharacterized protein n=1 Tax=Deinococcus koreensis TaxID=2054903 RepID=A0A2K3URQ8_9DEIO|nr:hypothetical protein CVO96_20140 [Deinococcus koreensis]